MTSAGGTRTVGYTGALRTVSPTSPSKSLTPGWDGPSVGPFPRPHPLVKLFQEYRQLDIC